MDNEKTIIGDNIVGQLNLLLLNVPEDLTTIEKIRWLYIKTGELFSYNYNIVEDPSLMDEIPNFDGNYINSYQTCTQISYLLCLMINQIDETCKCRVIPRVIEGRNVYGDEHKAIELELSTGEKYILDLTVDLYLIQSGCRTKQFGYTTDIYSTYDIISLAECEKIDRKLGLIKDGEYTDEKIIKLQIDLENKNYEDMKESEIVEYKMKEITKLIDHFSGHLEAKQYINKLFNSLLSYSYKEYNFTYRNEKENQIATCFVIETTEKNKWYLYTKNIGLIETNPETLDHMLDNGWSTRSTSFESVLEDEFIKRGR